MRSTITVLLVFSSFLLLGQSVSLRDSYNFGYNSFGKDIATEDGLILISSNRGTSNLYTYENGTLEDKAEFRTTFTPRPRLGNEVAIVNGQIFLADDEAVGIYIFDEPTGGWKSATTTRDVRPEDHLLTASNGTAEIGRRMEVSTDRIVTIADNENAVYVYEKPTTGWATATESVIINATTIGLDLVGAIHLAGQEIYVGGRNQSGQLVVVVFDYNGTTWTRRAELGPITGNGIAERILFDATTNSLFVSSKGTFPVGIFIKPASGWVDRASFDSQIPVENTYDRIGTEIKIHDDQLFILDREDLNSSSDRQSQLRVFQRTGSDWTQNIKVSTSLVGLSNKIGFDGAFIFIGQSLRSQTLLIYVQNYALSPSQTTGALIDQNPTFSFTANETMDLSGTLSDYVSVQGDQSGKLSFNASANGNQLDVEILDVLFPGEQITVTVSNIPNSDNSKSSNILIQRFYVK
ncbi:MAG: hypothetical protein AAFY41_04145, partial [Bacteroidota bacterium]